MFAAVSDADVTTNGVFLGGEEEPDFENGNGCCWYLIAPSSRSCANIKPVIVQLVMVPSYPTVAYNSVRILLIVLPEVSCIVSGIRLRAGCSKRCSVSSSYSTTKTMFKVFCCITGRTMRVKPRMTAKPIATAAKT